MKQKQGRHTCCNDCDLVIFGELNRLIATGLGDVPRALAPSAREWGNGTPIVPLMKQFVRQEGHMIYHLSEAAKAAA